MEISVGAYWAMIAITKSGLNDFRAAHMACCAIHKDHRVPSFHARHSMSDIRCPTFDARHSMPDIRCPTIQKVLYQSLGLAADNRCKTLWVYKLGQLNRKPSQ